MTMKKICISLVLAFLLTAAGSSWVFAALQIPGWEPIKEVSHVVDASWNVVNDIQNVWMGLYKVVKRIVMGLMVIYTVYIGAMMIMSMGSDEEQLSGAKRQIWYMLVALIFINIPEVLFNAFKKDGNATVGNSIDGTFTDVSSENSQNLFFDFTTLSIGLNNQIIAFLEVMVALAALFMITLAGINLIASRGREEKMSEAKNKIVYSVLALIFVGMIEAWKRLAFGWNLEEGKNLFESLANLALFFAAPVAIFFLTLAGYYYITSNGDEERIKKAKSIIVNTIFATLILLASYTFLIDLASLPTPK